MTTQAQSQASAALQDATVIFKVLFHRPGITRKGDLSRVTTPADKKRLRLSKRILDSPEYGVTGKVKADFMEYVGRVELDSHLPSGEHLIPVGKIEEVYRRLEAVEDEYKEAVAEFIAAYPEQIETSRVALDDQFRESDYPPAEQLLSAFWVEHSIQTWEVPSESKLGEYVYQREQEKIASRLEEEAAKAMWGLRTVLHEMTTGLRDAMLGRNSEGNRKKLSPKNIKAVVEWCQNWKDRNVMADDELTAIVDELKAVVCGVGENELVTNKGLRATSAEQMAEVVSKLDTLLVDAPARLIALEDDGV